MFHVKHILVSGMTRHGKTYYAHHLFKNQKGIFLNPRDENIPHTIKVNSNYSSNDIIRGISRAKLNYVLDGDLSIAKKEVDLIINKIMSEKWTSPVMVLVDECQDFCREGDLKSQVLRLARTGLGNNIVLVSIVQRIADLSKIVVTQSEKKIFFRIADEDFNYLKNKGYPVEEIKKRIADRKYYFVEYEGGELSNAKKL